MHIIAYLFTKLSAIINRSVFGNLINILALVLLPMLLQAGRLISILNSPISPGWDGSAHLGMLQQYKDNIYPALYGWINNWGGGTPWTVGYSPLYSTGLAFLSESLQLSLELTIKLVLVAACLLIPVLIYLLALTIHKSRHAALTAGLGTIVFMLSNLRPEVSYGYSYMDTFDVGLYSQTIAAVFLLLALIFTAQKNIVAFPLAILFSAATLLTNTHTGIALALILSANYSVRFFTARGYKAKSVVLLKTVAHAATTVLLCCFWLVPLAEVEQYMQTKSMPSIQALQLIPLLILPVALIVLVAKKFTKQQKEFLWALLPLLVVTIAPIYLITRDIPLQPSRYTPVLILIIVLLSSAAISFVVQYLTAKRIGKTAILISAVILTIAIYGHQVYLGSMGIYRMNEGEQELTQFLRSKTDGRSLIEMFLNTYPENESTKSGVQPTSIILSGEIGKDTKHETIWGIFREETLSSAFTQPLRNSFSAKGEAYGVFCWLCSNVTGNYDEGYKTEEFYYQALHIHLERAVSMGVKYIAVRSDQIKSLLSRTANQHGWTKTSSFGYWDLYTYDKPNPLVFAAQTDPILTFAPLLTRSRAVDSYDWLRINEEMFFHGQTDDHLLALAKSSFIDNAQEELKKFKLTFAPTLSYQNLEKAFEVISNYLANQNRFIIFDSEEELIVRLKSSFQDSPYLKVLSKTNDVRVDMLTLSDYLHQIYTDSRIYSYWYPYRNDVVKYEVSNSKIDIVLKHDYVYEPVTTKEDFIPTIVRYNYFPWWQSQNDIYMTSPTFMLVMSKPDSATLLEFKPSETAQKGAEITLLGLQIVIFGQFLAIVWACQRLIRRFVTKIYEKSRPIF